MTTVKRTLGNSTSKPYKKSGGTYYPATLSDEEVRRLERARKEGLVVDVAFREGGDVTRRLCTVGRSMGTIKVALFCVQGLPHGDPVDDPRVERWDVREKRPEHIR